MGDTDRLISRERWVMKYPALVILAAAAVFLSACSNQASGEPSAEVVWVGSMAQVALVDQLNAPLEEVRITKIESATWPDTCLGLPKDGESCQPVQTEGYHMEFSVGAGTCAVRANASGSNMRIRCIIDSCVGDCHVPK